MDIHRAEKLAQDRSVDAGWDKSFLLVGPKGAIECEWLDPYFGIFKMKDSDGFMMTKQIPEFVEVIMPDEHSVS